MRGHAWLALLPRHLPALSLMLQDIGNPSAPAIAKALGVNESTVYRWKAEDKAPRAALLALYYATSWGQSDVNCQAENDAQLYFGYVAALRAELAQANAKLERLGQIGEFGSANDPVPGVKAQIQAPPPQPAKPRKKTASQKRADLAAKRLADRVEGPPKPFDFLRTG